MNERMLEGHRLFAVEHRGEQALKGIDRPVQLLPVVQPAEYEGGSKAAAAARGLTPFVGREDKLLLLINR
jgi:hypothetical protein